MTFSHFGLMDSPAVQRNYINGMGIFTKSTAAIKALSMNSTPNQNGRINNRQLCKRESSCQCEHHPSFLALISGRHMAHATFGNEVEYQIKFKKWSYEVLLLEMFILFWCLHSDSKTAPNKIHIIYIIDKISDLFWGEHTKSYLNQKPVI